MSELRQQAHGCADDADPPGAADGTRDRWEVEEPADDRLLITIGTETYHAGTWQPAEPGSTRLLFLFGRSGDAVAMVGDITDQSDVPDLTEQLATLLPE